MRKITLIILSIFICLLTNAQKKDISLEEILLEYSLYPKGFSNLKSMNSGEHYSILKRIDDHQEIIKYKFKDGLAERTIFNSSDFKIKRVSNYSFSKNEKLILLATETESIYRYSKRAKYFVFNVHNNKIKEVHQEKIRYPSFSPDGSKVVFESDRSGTQQLYIMPSNGGNAKRISFGKGSYGTPFWAPTGNLIAFTKQNEGVFHIGIMSSEGLEETLLTTSFLDEGPTWSPNGRVIMFTRETSGSGGSSTLYSVDVTGQNLKPVRANSSDPSWSKLLN